VTCFNCREPGHISTHCDKPKKAPDAPSTKGRVFALTGEEPDTQVIFEDENSISGGEV
jgi:hypothetical protein